MSDRIEIRMLGRLLVRRDDGTLVETDDWSTGKTTDLLRLLALSANRQVSVTSLLDKLWPDVNDVKARASLRTAASRIRRVLGSDCIDRHLGGLVLRNVWVDTVALQAIQNEAKSAMHARDLARVVSLAREAEALYVADFRAYDDKSNWATDVRESIKLKRQTLLADAAEAAVHLLWMRDAIDFATLAIAEDACFERAHRALMLAHAGLGEIELALRAFEHCRVNLSQELGADPSPQTRALHIQILSGEIEEMTLTPFTGRADEVSALIDLIATSIAHDGFDVICLTGPEGSGRGALLNAAAARVPHAHLRRMIEDLPNSSQPFRLAGVSGQRRTDVAVWFSADGDSFDEVSRILRFLSALDLTLPRVMVIVTSGESGDLLADKLAGGPIALHRQKTGAISDSDLAALATSALSAPPTPQLLRELRMQSEGLAGSSVSILREWLSSGWIVSTIAGLDLYNDGAAAAGVPPVGDEFRFLLEQLTPQELDFCQLIAVINWPMSIESIFEFRHLLAEGRSSLSDIEDQLDEMADLGVLQINVEGYSFRNQSIRDAFESWLRPAKRARLLRSVKAIFDELEVPAELKAGRR